MNIKKKLLREFIQSAVFIHSEDGFTSYFYKIYKGQIKRVYFYKEGLLVLTKREGLYYITEDACALMKKMLHSYPTFLYIIDIAEELEDAV